MSFKDDISIDRHDLRGEWLRQASTYHYYLMLSVDAQRDREKLKVDHDVLVAELYDSHRARIESVMGASKVTETAIKRSMENDNDYQNS